MTDRIGGIHSEENPQNLTQPTLAFLRNYWERKRGAAAMPRRSDISPLEMKQHLGWIILLESLPTYADFRYRLVGTRVTQYFLADATGRTITEAFSQGDPAATKSPAAKAVLAIHRKTARDKVIMRSYGGAGWLGRDYLEFDSIYLPLSDDGEFVNMILSAFTFDAAKLMRTRDPAGST
jgi:hypothetical protein